MEKPQFESLSQGIYEPGTSGGRTIEWLDSQ